MKHTSARITERHPIPGPLVYGYLRLPAPNPARRQALTWAVRAYCDQHELVLGAVFTDSLTPAVLSAAFAGLLDALAVEGSYGVVTPSTAHLGGRRLGQERTGLIAVTGRRLMLVRGTTAAATR
ncbi:hypothetical protein GCM10009555_043300 [Acrocarpospora macrocephala]|uniref:Resolvase/invertase-type recombinase catalytic domain-containing protein n=1 Tax=Acrocarpospora macrocephala TaxID=150177 RepID=A0A5M3WD70_9ACTN|nr:hypothetical protein [Acrocarpospora macrocephala]GES07007.1 hypothetical protein Amac_006020 [Acrocarpospora macrocephala]